MKISELVNGLEVLQIEGNESVEVSGVFQDSRKVGEGGLFIAINGSGVDGHSFVNKAVENGAVCVVYSEEIDKKEGVVYVKVRDTHIALGKIAAKFYGNPTEKMKLVGVTGTNGKTTTTTLLYKLFREAGYKVGLVSTIAIYVDEKRYDTKNTTPDVLTLNSYFREMVDAGVSYCFMEVSSHGVVQKRIEGLKFAGGVFTNLTHDHLDYHKTFSAYRDAKKGFFDILGKEAFALVNVDDANGNYMLQNTKARKYSYSLKSVSDFKLKVIENCFSGLVVKIEGEEVWTNLIGEFNAYNLLAIYSSAVLLGMDKMEAMRIISTLKSVEGRFQYIVSKRGVTGIVDYAHTPDALENVISTINDIRQKGGEKLVVVVGCGGDRDKTKRPVMAEIAVREADKVILTSDNPRSEEPEAILADMEKGVSGEFANKYVKITDRREAIKTACMMCQSGDIVLVAGKGHETYQEVKGVRSHFDDMEELKGWLER